MNTFCRLIALEIAFLGTGLVAAAGTITDVMPAQGPFGGGSVVTITGSDLGSGADITNVTLCGAMAVIQTQGVNMVVVEAGPAVSWGTGDVRIVSASRGVTLSVSAYFYNAPGYIHGAFLGWNGISNLPAPRGWLGAAAAGGKIFAIGGADSGAQADVFAYDPAAPTAGWASVSNLPVNLTDVGATAVGGTLYAISGTNTLAYATALPEQGWVGIDPLPAARSYPGVAEACGRLYVAAGDDTTPQSSFFEYDPANPAGGWVALPDLPAARSGMPALGLNGRIYAIGGNDGTNAQDTVYEFDLRNPAGGWVARASLPQARHRHGIATLAGRIFVVAGQDASDTPCNTLYCLDPAEPGASWAVLDPLPAVRYALAAAADGEALYAIGGVNAAAEDEVFQAAFDKGVVPAFGAVWETNVVVITGTRLGDGADITNVTLCGIPAAILNQSATQVVVSAAAAPAPIRGDVVVVSTSRGRTVRPDAFAYGYRGRALYVDAANPNPQLPYTNWAIAATSIQDAVDAAWPGDTVWVTNGNYQYGARAATTNNLTLTRVCISNALTVKSVGGPTFTTIVGAPDPDTAGHGTNAVRCAYLTGGATLSGFTLVGGRTRAAGPANRERAGGGAFIEGGAVLTNCIIASNAASGNGGGVYCGAGCAVYDSVVITNAATNGGGLYVNGGLISGCTITFNRAFASGGGAYLQANGLLTDSSLSRNRCTDDGAGVLANGKAFVRNCDIVNNRADGTYGSGGGIMLYYGGRLECSVVSSNYSSYCGGGAAIYAGDGSINNCLLKNNLCSAYGGGLYCYSGGSPVVNSTIVSNRSYYYYGGVNCNYTGVFYNTIIYYNKATTGCDDIGGNAGIAYNSCISVLTQGLWTAVGCITNPPQFMDLAAGDFRLSSTSPCLDSGSNQLTIGATDLIGVRRIIGPHVDMGAYEYGVITSAIAPPVITAPCLVPEGAAGFYTMTNQTAITIAGTKPTDSYVANPFLTNDMDQTAAGTTWTQRQVALVPLPTGATSVFTFATVATNLAAVSSATTTLTVVNYRVPPAIDIANGDGTVSYDVTQVDLAGTHSLAVGLLRWTNSLGGGNIFPAVSPWSVPGIPLKVGTNRITVFGTNVLGNLASNFVNITRGPEGTGVPVVAITNAPPWVYYYVNSATVQGTNLNIVGQLRWVNDRVPAVTNAFSTGFSASVTNLQYGWNTVTISGTNRYGVSASDNVSIYRQTMNDRFAITNYVWRDNPNTPVPPYATWDTAATSIQDAVSAALTGSMTGTVVLVTNGVYAVTSQWISLVDVIQVVSVNGPDVTVVDGGAPQATGRCFLINHPLAVLDGFTIRNAAWSANGGGVYVGTQGGLVSNCVFVDCAAAGNGGGLYLNKAGLVELCRFDRCTATNGGGFWLEQGGEIHNSTVSNCVATAKGGGGCLYGGGRLYSCLITRNSAARGGGIWSQYYPGRLDNCTIVSNQAMLEGGGVNLREGAIMKASVVWSNTAPAGTNWFKLSPIDVDSSCTWPSLGSNCITNDPAFVDFDAGDYHLRPVSSCIDAGANLPWMNGAVDLDGHPRIIGPVVDIGAYESGYMIQAAAGADGSITPSGSVWVAAGTDITFTNIPDALHHVLEVLVDGVSAGAPSTYTFTNVVAAHTVAVAFAENLAAPVVEAATGVTSNSFVGNWSAGVGGSPTNFVLNVTNLAGYVAGYSNRSMGLATTCTVSNLAAGTKYWYWVYAQGVADTSPDSAVMDVTTVSVMVPGGAIGDYDGDGQTDLLFFDQSAGLWYVFSLEHKVILWGVRWGWPGATQVDGDYDGDGKNDLAVYNRNDGRWYIRSVGGDVIAWGAPWGGKAAVPVPGDYDGDGRSDLAVCFTNSGLWYVYSLSKGVITLSNRWGWAGAIPVAGDYNRDGKADLAVFDDVRGRWYIKTLVGNQLAWNLPWGWRAALPVRGDYDGDGASDLALFNDVTGRWYIRTLAGQVLAWDLQWGWPGAIPRAGDYDGDSRADPAVYNPTSGSWYIWSLKKGVVGWGIRWGGGLLQ